MVLTGTWTSDFSVDSLARLPLDRSPTEKGNSRGSRDGSFRPRLFIVLIPEADLLSVSRWFLWASFQAVEAMTDGLFRMEDKILQRPRFFTPQGYGACSVRGLLFLSVPLRLCVCLAVCKLAFERKFALMLTPPPMFVSMSRERLCLGASSQNARNEFITPHYRFSPGMNDDVQTSVGRQRIEGHRLNKDRYTQRYPANKTGRQTGIDNRTRSLKWVTYWDWKIRIKVV